MTDERKEGQRSIVHTGSAIGWYRCDGKDCPVCGEAPAQPEPRGSEALTHKEACLFSQVFNRFCYSSKLQDGEIFRINQFLKKLITESKDAAPSGSEALHPDLNTVMLAHQRLRNIVRIIVTTKNLEKREIAIRDAKIFLLNGETKLAAATAAPSMRVCNRPGCGNGPLDDVCEVCRAKDAATAERTPLKPASPKLDAPQSREEILASSFCGIAGHFKFQENGSNCLMCQREHQAEQRGWQAAIEAAAQPIRALIEKWRVSCSVGPLLKDGTVKPVDAREAKLRCADELEIVIRPLRPSPAPQEPK